jgi:hypothetical protein
LTINPDQRYTKHTIQASQAIAGICTGIVKQKTPEVLKSKHKKMGIHSYLWRTDFGAR